MRLLISTNFHLRRTNLNSVHWRGFAASQLLLIHWCHWCCSWPTTSPHSLIICLKVAASTIHRHRSWHDSEWLHSNRTPTKRHWRSQPHSHRLLYWRSSWHQRCAEWTHSAIDRVVIVAAVWVCAFVCRQLHFFPPSNVQPWKAGTGLTCLGKYWLVSSLLPVSLAACLSKINIQLRVVWFLRINTQFNSYETWTLENKLLPYSK